MSYLNKNYEIIKQQDGSLIERIGSKETVYKKPFVPFSFEIEEITYSKTLYNPHGEEIFPVTDEERGLDPYYDPENTERFRGKGQTKFIRVSHFGCSGDNRYDITIVPMVGGTEKESRGYLDVFKDGKQPTQTYQNSLEVHIEQEVFNDLKELYFLKNLKHIKINLNFSKENNIYHDMNLESKIEYWKIFNETEENYTTVRGLVERVDFVTHPQSLRSYRPGERY